jgi:SAM-dependent methyltransferase
MAPLLAAAARPDIPPAAQHEDVAEFQHELHGFHAAPYGVILDAGCGAGDVTRHLAERFPTNIVIGIDGSAVRIAQARAGRRLPNIAFSAGDLRRLKLDDDSIDQVVCRFALQALDADGRRAVLGEFLRVLKPGGAIVAVDFDGFTSDLSPATALLETAEREMQGGRLADLPVGRQLPALLRAAGFEDIQAHVERASAHGGAERHAARFTFDEAAFDAAFGAAGTGRQLHLDLAACLALPQAVLQYYKAVVLAAKPGEAA